MNIGALTANIGAMNSSNAENISQPKEKGPLDKSKHIRRSIFQHFDYNPKMFDSKEGETKSMKLLWLQFLSLAYNSDETNLENGAFDAPDWLMLIVKIHQTTIILVAFTAITLLCVESLPMFYRGDKTIDALNLACIAYFIFDLVLKFSGMRNRDFFNDPFTWIDALTILPFFLELITDTLQGVGVFLVFRVLRLTRIFRVLKLSKFNEEINIVFSTVLKSGSAMRLLVFLFVILVTVLSSFIFFVEQQWSTFRGDVRLWVRDDDTISPYQSIPHSMWWCIVTLTTVGYGDDVPTNSSQVIASLTMFMGIITLAFPTIILSANFVNQKKAFVERKQIRTNRAKRKLLTLGRLLKGLRVTSAEPFVTFERSAGGELGIVRKKQSFIGKPWRWYVFENTPFIKRAADGSIEIRDVDPCTVLLTIVTAASDADISAATIKVREKVPDVKQLAVMPLHPTAMKIVTNLAEIAPYATVISPSWCDDCTGHIPMLIRTRVPSQVQMLRDSLSEGFVFTPRVRYDEITRRMRSVTIHHFALNGMMDTLMEVESEECFPMGHVASFEILNSYGEMEPSPKKRQGTNSLHGELTVPMEASLSRKRGSIHPGVPRRLPRRLDIAYVATNDLLFQIRASVPTLACVKACVRNGMRLANRDAIADVIVRHFRKQCPRTTYGRLTPHEKMSLIDRGNPFRESSEIIQLDTKVFDLMTVLCVTGVETVENF